ncbi:lonely Cys domain-containing protein [Streptomyces lydicus]|nr:lonely Cys domain-containing protein [Streptomyces lydicus]
MPLPKAVGPGYDAVLHELFGASAGRDHERTRVRAALERLDALSAGDPRLRPDGSLDLAALVRRVLMLERTEPATPADLRDLLKAALDPRAGGPRSLDRLSAVHLVRKGVFDARFRLLDDQGNPRGWDWGSGVPPQADLSTSGTVTTDQGGATAVTNLGTAPWGDRAQLYAANSTARSVRVRGLQGFSRLAPHRVFAELVDLDPVLPGVPAEVPLLLWTPNVLARNLNLPDALAHRQNRSVFATGGNLVWAPLPGPQPRFVPALDNRGTEGVWASWLRRDPAEVRDGAVDWNQEEITWSLPGPDHRLHGSVSFDFAAEPDKGRSRTRNYARAAAVRRYVVLGKGRGKSAEPPKEVRWKVSPFNAATHGRPAVTFWQTVRGEQRLPARESARRMARQVDRAGLAPDAPVLVGSCSAATPRPVVFDRLADLPIGQYMANESKRGAYAPPYEISLEPEHDVVEGSTSDELVWVLFTDERGVPADWVFFLPEPEGAELDEVARLAQLHDGSGPASEADRYRVLRLVRALRLVFGADVGDRPDYAQLISGIGALEVRREADPALHRPGGERFTMELFEELAREHAGHGPGAPAVSPVGYLALLTESADRWEDGERGAPLTGWLRLPEVTRALEAMSARQFRDNAARDILSLPAEAPLGEADYSRALWALVRTEQLAAGVTDQGGFAQRILRLDAPDPGRYLEAMGAVRRALAAGRDARNLDELASHGLELAGLLSPERLLKAPDGSSWGRGISQQSGPSYAPEKFEPTKITLMERAPDGSLVPSGITEEAPWKAADGSPPFVYTGFGSLPPLGQLADLAYRDPALRALPTDIPVVTTLVRAPGAGRGPFGSALAELARSVAKQAWASTRTTGLHRDEKTGVLTLAVYPETWEQRAPEGTWRWANPVHGDPLPAVSSSAEESSGRVPTRLPAPPVHRAPVDRANRPAAPRPVYTQPVDDPESPLRPPAPGWESAGPLIAAYADRPEPRTNMPRSGAGTAPSSKRGKSFGGRTKSSTGPGTPPARSSRPRPGPAPPPPRPARPRRPLPRGRRPSRTPTRRSSPSCTVRRAVTRPAGRTPGWPWPGWTRCGRRSRLSKAARSTWTSWPVTCCCWTPRQR